MGSTGTGHLTDYSGYKKAVVGKTGGKDTVYICNKAVATSLEDVATSETPSPCTLSVSFSLPLFLPAPFKTVGSGGPRAELRLLGADRAGPRGRC